MDELPGGKETGGGGGGRTVFLILAQSKVLMELKPNCARHLPTISTSPLEEVAS